MSQEIRCHFCGTDFPIEPEALRPYRDGLIRGQRMPRYWVRCPQCDRKNVFELFRPTETIVGRPAAR